jgi:antitoxin (DNA-binding transcriptional repressor) of toxin-antitoxin stability system
MREVSLREFRTRGEQALKLVPQGETILLSGQKGPAYYLIPVQGDIALGDKELRRAVARMNLQENARWAAEQGQMSDEEIDAEIQLARQERSATSLQ